MQTMLLFYHYGPSSNFSSAHFKCVIVFINLHFSSILCNPLYGDERMHKLQDCLSVCSPSVLLAAIQPPINTNIPINTYPVMCYPLRNFVFLCSFTNLCDADHEFVPTHKQYIELNYACTDQLDCNNFAVLHDQNRETCIEVWNRQVTE